MPPLASATKIASLPGCVPEAIGDGLDSEYSEDGEYGGDRDGDIAGESDGQASASDYYHGP